MGQKVIRFEKDHWYRYNVRHTSTPSGWNDKMMDVCDGAPCLCIYGDRVYAEFAGHKHFDSDGGITDKDIISGRKYTRGWIWSDNFENWEEVSAPAGVGFFGILKAGTVQGYEDPEKEADSLKYSFEFPKRSDLCAELLKKLRR